MAEDFRIKTEKEAIETEIQNIRLGTYMDVKTIGDKDTIITELDIKNETVADAPFDPDLNRIKYEKDIMTRFSEGTDKKAVEVKIEPYMNVQKFEHMETETLTSEIDIKNENHASIDASEDSELNSANMKKEIRKEHDIERIYLEACAKYQNLNKHKSKHPERSGSYNLDCIRCNVRCRTKRILDEHTVRKHPDLIASVSYEIHKCPFCAYKTILVTHLARHIWKHKSSTCACCDAKFKSKQALDNHTIKRHPDLMDSVSGKIFECKKCKYKTTTWRNLRKHTCMTSNSEKPGRRKGTTFICCDTAFKRKIFLDDHITKNHPDTIASVSSKILECPMCTYKTTIRRCLASHMSKHSGTPDNLNQKAFYKLNTSCVACGVTFKRKISLDDHIIKNHPDLIASVKSKIYECTCCTYKTTTRRNLDRHVSQRHPETTVNYEPSICACCNATFKSKITLDDHTLKKHPDLIGSVSSEIFGCTDCAYKTTTRIYLSRHVMTQHYHIPRSSELKPRTCLECNATFKSKKSLDDHTIKKHPHLIASVTSKIHECAYCKYRTTQASDSSRHMYKHPEAGGKYASHYNRCTSCNETFKSKIALDNHTFRRHPEIISCISSKIHECTICPYKTIMERNLSRHLLRHGKKVCRYQETTCCARCKTEFKTRYALEDHITRKHPDLRASVSSKIYECTSCTYKTTMKSNFARHLLTHPETSVTAKIHH